MIDQLRNLDPAAVAAATNDSKKAAAWLKDLGAEDASVRSRAAFLLAQLPVPPDKAVSKLTARVKKEPDPIVKASLLLALGEVSRRTGDRRATDLLNRATGDDRELTPKPPPLPVRVAAVIALGRTYPLRLFPSMIDFLKQHTELRVDPALLPWHEGDLGGIAALVLPTMETLDLPSALEEIRALIAAYPFDQDRSGVGWAEEVSYPWAALVDRVLAPLGDRRNDEPLLSELSADQRRVLEFAMESGLFVRAIEYGLEFQTPYNRASWRRYLGLDPAGVIDRPLTLELEGVSTSFPIWKWFRMLSRNQITAEPLTEALRAALSPAEIVDLARDVTRLMYAMPTEDVRRTPRVGVVRELLKTTQEVVAPDLDGIHFVLDALHNGKGWDLKGAGWESGPFIPTDRSKFDK